MTFLETLQSHKGGLIRIKTPLYWYGGGGYDNNPGRICLILDAATIGAAPAAMAATAVAAVTITAATTVAARRPAAADAAAAHLLIDGQSAWIWVVGQDIELLVNNQPIS